jgi:hypothetical protein
LFGVRIETKVMFLSKYSLDRKIPLLRCFIHNTVYHRFLDSGVLWFAEHYFLGDWGSRLHESLSYSLINVVMIGGNLISGLWLTTG